jgi:glyoxylase-like metal-dependent hydrolase (beta-lactamase superfamily II)
MYTNQKINKDTTLIIDKYKESLILIEGSQKALLIDTGMDLDNLYDYVKQLTDKPIIVALTHGHIDHIGRSGDFKDVYMNLSDKDVYLEHMHLNMGHFKSEGLNFKNISDINELPKFFDLGNKIIDVIALPGHTVGSTIFIDKDNQCIYSGDAIGSGCGVWMQLDESLNISDYEKALDNAIKKLEEIGVDDSWMFIGGHYGQENESQVSSKNILDFTLMKDMKLLCCELLNHNIEYHDTKATALSNKPYYVSYKRAEMIITKEKVK